MQAILFEVPPSFFLKLLVSFGSSEMPKDGQEGLFSCCFFKRQMRRLTLHQMTYFLAVRGMDSLGHSLPTLAADGKGNRLWL